MEQNTLQDVVRDALNEAELRSREIPTIDLYVDQILNLVSERIEEGSTRYRDKVLTKTMINNYSKDGLITPVKGKKYTAEQIVQILTVNTLKSTLTIGEIKRLLQGMYAIEGFDGNTLTAMYDRHLAIKEENRTLTTECMERIVERDSLNLDDELDYVTAAEAMLSLSAQLRNVARAMIDARYPEPDETEEKEAKKEEKEAKKEEKKEEKERVKQEKAKAKESKKASAEEDEA